MNAYRLMAALGWLAPLLAFGQTVPDDHAGDPVLDSIREFNDRQPNKPNEVTVVLEPSPDAAPQKKETPSTEPILVTGKPPQHVELAPPAQPSAPQEPEMKLVEPPIPEEEGLSVDVEKLQTGKGVIQTGTIKLLAPFPAKPLSATPTGWKLDAQANVPPLKKEVELSPGKKITLTIRPHVLVPEVDGATSFSVGESGYNPALGYQQTATVGAVLSQSIRQLEDDSRLLGNAIDNLQQLLVSLPSPDIPPAAPSPTPSPKR